MLPFRFKIMWKVNLQGKKFGRWKVIKFVEKKGRMFFWECICECGTIRNVNGSELRLGRSKSCGCLVSDLLSKRNETHGYSDTKFYKKFRRMKQRCEDISNKNYGGRGIKCLWNSFEEFKEDMYESYLEHIEKFGKRNTTIERIENNEGYSKKNCEWTTWEKQGINKRNTLFITYKGQKKTLLEWSKLLNVNYHTLRYRLKLGLPITK